jgi:hypothetical protein
LRAKLVRISASVSNISFLAAFRARVKKIPYGRTQGLPGVRRDSPQLEIACGDAGAAA